MKVLKLFVLLSLLFNCSTYKSVTQVSGSYLLLTKSDQKILTREIAEEKSKDVEIFYQKDATKEYKEIGIVEAVGHGQEVSLQDLFPELQKQAAIINADAIIKITLQRYNHGSSAMHATAVAVKFK